ncbi:MAG TPA: SUMF1/EgtB/PvdO family nonheme iron enzyme, partial [Labilithrix sp.]
FTWRNPGFPQGEDHPVVLVTFGDAVAYAAWASRKTGKRVRLPTESEYEYATRAGTTTPWYGAKSEDEALALGWFRQNAGAGTRPVGQKRPNAFGLFDMSGDVYEWCRDVYVPGYPREPAVDPELAARTDTEPERRVLRGGSWFKDPKRGRSAARFRSAPGSRSADIGFRVVVTEDDAIAPGLAIGGGAPVAQPIGAPSSSASPELVLSDGGTATITEPRSSGELTWLLFAGPAAAAAAAVAWMLVRKRDLVGAHARAVDEGFFVRVLGAATGTRVYYTCVVDGAALEGETTVNGEDETFVRTRARPAAVRVRELAPGAPRTRIADALRRSMPDAAPASSRGALEPPPESSRPPRTEPLPMIEPISEPSPRTQPMPKIEPALVVPTPQSPQGVLAPQKAPIVESSPPADAPRVPPPLPSVPKVIVAEESKPPSRVPPPLPSAPKVPVAEESKPSSRVPPPVPSAPKMPVAEESKPPSRVPPPVPSAPKVPVAEESKPSSRVPPPLPASPKPAPVAEESKPSSSRVPPPVPSAPKVPVAEESKPSSRVPPPLPSVPKVAAAEESKPPPLPSSPKPAPVATADDAKAAASSSPAKDAPDVAALHAADARPGEATQPLGPSAPSPFALSPSAHPPPLAPAWSAPTPIGGAPMTPASSAPAPPGVAPASSSASSSAAASSSAPAPPPAAASSASPSPPPAAALSSVPATVHSPASPPRPSQPPSQAPPTIAAPPPVPSAPPPEPAAPHPSPSPSAPATLGAPPPAESSQAPATMVSPPIVSPSSAPRRDSSPPSSTSQRASRPMLYKPAEKVDDEPPDSAPSLAQLVSSSHVPEPSPSSEKNLEKEDDEKKKKKKKDEP